MYYRRMGWFFSDGIKITMTEIKSGNSIHLGLNYIDKELIKTIYEHYKGRKPVNIQLSVNEDSEWQTDRQTEIIDKDDTVYTKIRQSKLNNSEWYYTVKMSYLFLWNG